MIMLLYIFTNPGPFVIKNLVIFVIKTDPDLLTSVCDTGTGKLRDALRMRLNVLMFVFCSSH